MNTLVRTGVVLTVFNTALSGCSSVPTPFGGTSAPPARVPVYDLPSAPPSPSAPASLDDYKIQVARHVLDHNPECNYTGTLPPLLPAIVVLRITVDRDGQLRDVAIQRSPNDDAAAVALASLRRSAPLPAPRQLAQADGRLTFLETFLFADSSRYQLRSLAPRQASE